MIRWYDLFHAGCNGWWTKFSFISGRGDQSFVEADLDDEKMPKLTMEMRSRNSSPIIVFASSKKKKLRDFLKNLDKKMMAMVKKDGDGKH